MIQGVLEGRSGGENLIESSSLISDVGVFCDAWFRARKRSAKTETAYRSDLRQFAEIVGSDTATGMLSDCHIRDWLSHLRRNGYQPSSIRRKLAPLRHFLGNLCQAGALALNPLDSVRPHLGRQRRLTRFVSSGSFDALLNAADEHARRGTGGNQDCEFWARRDQAMIWLLCGTGIRVGELVLISLADLDRNCEQVKIMGKGDKERLALVVAGDRQRLRSYLDLRIRVFPDQDALFVNHRGMAISTEGVRAVLRKLTMKCGIAEVITPHMLRHTAATRLLERGVNLRVIQEYLGHSSIRSTERYTHVALGLLRRTLERYGPLSGDRPV